eukprot:gene11189-17207_t
MVEHKLLPEKGTNSWVLRAMQSAFSMFDADYRQGHVLALVFSSTSDIGRVQKAAYMRFLTENALDPTAFPSLLKFETETVSMVASHLNGPDTTVGSFTSGGTESCLLSMIAARNWARETRPEVMNTSKKPAILVARTVHAAFHKAAELMDLRLVIVEVDPVSLLPAVSDLRRALEENRDTVFAIVGSAGAYAHGVIDPVGEMSDLAEEFNVWFHVDGCIGGFVLQFFREFGLDVPVYDFRLPGVSSMSLDLHKYAFCAKSASVVMFRTPELRSHSVFTCADWIGYPIINSTLQSTRGGGPIAAAWTTLMYIGKRRYRSIMRDLFDGTQALKTGIPTIPGLVLVGDPKASLISFRLSDDAVGTLNIYNIVECMKKKGWTIQAQMSFDYLAPSMHVSVNPQMKNNAKKFLKCLAESFEEAKTLPMFDDLVQKAHAMLPKKGKITKADFERLCELCGMSFEEPPEMAGINTVLNSLSVPKRQELMQHFASKLFVHDEVVARRQAKEITGMLTKKAKSYAWRALTATSLIAGIVFLVRHLRSLR